MDDGHLSEASKRLHLSSQMLNWNSWTLLDLVLGFDIYILKILMAIGVE
jgi:hypothetical protein